MADLTIGGTSLAALGSSMGLGALGNLMGFGGGYSADAGFAPVTDKSTLGASVVSASFDALNAPGMGQPPTAMDYDFGKSVLGAVYNPTGGIADFFA